MYLLTKKSKEKIKIENKSFASGGEGALFKVISPTQYTHLVAKLYHRQEDAAEREEKLLYLADHVPSGYSSDSTKLCWIVDTLYGDKGIAGFLMPSIDGDSLSLLTMAKIPRKYRKKWERLKRSSKESMDLRLKICFNVATAVAKIYHANDYILSDLKPDNILANAETGLVTIVDTDSIAVKQGGDVLFPATVTTPEYAPSEFYDKEYNKSTSIQASWDNFGLAVIFYQILLGLHPYSASSKGAYASLVSLGDKIEKGLYVHNPAIQQHFSVIPPPHQQFRHLSPALQDLFNRAFTSGHKDDKKRPTAKQWAMTVAYLLNVQVRDLLYTPDIKEYAINHNRIRALQESVATLKAKDDLALDEHNFLEEERSIELYRSAKDTLAYQNILDARKTLLREVDKLYLDKKIPVKERKSWSLKTIVILSILTFGLVIPLYFLGRILRELSVDTKTNDKILDLRDKVANQFNSINFNIKFVHRIYQKNQALGDIILEEWDSYKNRNNKAYEQYLATKAKDYNFKEIMEEERAYITAFSTKVKEECRKLEEQLVKEPFFKEKDIKFFHNMDYALFQAIEENPEAEDLKALESYIKQLKSAYKEHVIVHEKALIAQISVLKSRLNDYRSQIDFALDYYENFDEFTSRFYLFKRKIKGLEEGHEELDEAVVELQELLIKEGMKAEKVEHILGLNTSTSSAIKIPLVKKEKILV